MMRPKSVKPVHNPLIWNELQRLMAGRDEVVAGKSFGYPALYYVDPDAAPAKGKRAKRRLFASAFEHGVALKLPADLAEELLGEAGFEPFTPYHMPPIRGWVLLAPQSPAELGEYQELLETALSMAICSS
jgi:hypothetical protein